MMDLHDLPALNASLNGVSALFLLAGYGAIRTGRIAVHRRLMTGALTSSGFFLISYLIYHQAVGSVAYPHHDWTRPLYFAILIPHVILATAMTPFIFVLVRRAWSGDFARHKRLARIIWPIWMFVSVSGVAVYFMLYHF